MASENTIIKESSIEVRFGWDAYPRQYSGGLVGGLTGSGIISVDCDASAIFCEKGGKPISDDLEGCCVNYANLKLFGDAVMHGGDNMTGELSDDEKIEIRLNELPADVDSIILTLDLFKEKKKIGTGKMRNTFIRVVAHETDEELARCDFGNLGVQSKIVIAGKISRCNDGWVFEPIRKRNDAPNMAVFIDGLR